MTTGILRQIDLDLPTLSRSETRIAEWIRENPRETVDASIGEVAAIAGVSEPTVIRFCRRLGLSGFRDLKTRLVAALQSPENFLHRDVDDDDGPSEAAAKVLDGSIRTLVDLREQTATMPFPAAVESMTTARELVFVGLGASGHVARDASHKFFRLGIPCSTAVDAQTIVQRAAVASARDVFVVISHTGTWPEIEKAMAMAAERHARIIALTDPRSPLAAAADLVFACHPVEDTNVFTPMSSRLAQLALLDALQIALALGLGEPAKQNLRASKAALSEMRARASGTA
ncbi:MAG: SIS domain-containing protein [Pseudomonadales bacterium]|nr:MurR/RpiR family transcriptional regulator [Pseudomonadales bacterium]NIX06991.1 SIS domain-containing protein [Pseudomonadales bacterium]